MKKNIISFVLALTILFGSIGSVSAFGCTSYDKVFLNGQEYGEKYDNIGCSVSGNTGVQDWYFIWIKGKPYTDWVEYILNENGKETIKSKKAIYVYDYKKNKIIWYYKWEKAILQVNGKKYVVEWLWNPETQENNVYTDEKWNYGFFIKKWEKYKVIINGKEKSKEFEYPQIDYFYEYFTPQVSEKTNTTENKYIEYETKNENGNSVLYIDGKKIVSVKWYTKFRVSEDRKTYWYIQLPKEDSRTIDLNTFAPIGKDMRTKSEKQYHLIINWKSVFSAKESINDFQLNNLGYKIDYTKNGKRVHELYLDGKKILSSPYNIRFSSLSNNKWYYIQYFKNSSDAENYNGTIILNGKEIGQVSLEDVFNTPYYKIYSGEGEKRIQTLMKDNTKVIENATEIKVEKTENGDILIEYKKDGKNIVNLNEKDILKVEKNIEPIFGRQYKNDYSNYHYTYTKNGNDILNINGNDIISIASNLYPNFEVNNDYKGYSYTTSMEKWDIEYYYYNSIDTKYLNDSITESKTEVNTSQNTKKDVGKKLDTVIEKAFVKIDALWKQKATKKYETIIIKIDEILKKKPNYKYKDILIYLQKKCEEKIK